MAISVNAAVSVNSAAYSVNGGPAISASTASLTFPTPILSIIYASGRSSSPVPIYEV